MRIDAKNQSYAMAHDKTERQKWPWQLKVSLTNANVLLASCLSHLCIALLLLLQSGAFCCRKDIIASLGGAQMEVWVFGNVQTESSTGINQDISGIARCLVHLLYHGIAYMGRMPQLQECVICILLTLGYIEFGTQLNQTYCHQRAKVMSSGQVLSLQLSFWKGM